MDIWLNLSLSLSRAVHVMHMCSFEPLCKGCNKLVAAHCQDVSLVFSPAYSVPINPAGVAWTKWTLSTFDIVEGRIPHPNI